MIMVDWSFERLIVLQVWEHPNILSLSGMATMTIKPFIIMPTVKQWSADESPEGWMFQRKRDELSFETLFTEREWPDHSSSGQL